jgi:uncharacterized protein (TIGR03083 family)
MERPQPVLVVDLFPAVQQGLVDLLASLALEDWQRPIANSTWTVKDVALHLLGGDLGNLSRRRDAQESRPEKPIQSREELAAFINDLNDVWVRATRRLSPRLITDLLRFMAPQFFSYFKSLDPFALGGAVSWAGPGPAPVWLDIAREYTERWYHQQQIRDAVGKPGFKERMYFAPVLETFVQALPLSYKDVQADEGTTVVLTITGDSGNRWCVRREGQAWILYTGAPTAPDAEMIIDQDTAWRLFTRGIPADEAPATLNGDQRLARKIFDAVAIIA